MDGRVLILFIIMLLLAFAVSIYIIINEWESFKHIINITNNNPFYEQYSKAIKEADSIFYMLIAYITIVFIIALILLAIELQAYN